MSPRKKYLNISYDEKTHKGVHTPTDRVAGVEPDIYAQLNLLTRLMPNVAHVTRWKPQDAGRQQPRFHDRFHEMIVVISGEGSFHINGTKYPVRARDVILIKPTDLHGHGSGSNFEVIAIHFSLVSLSEMVKKGRKTGEPLRDDFLSFISRHYIRIRKVSMTSGSQIINKAVQVLDEFGQVGPGSRLMCSLATVELLIMVARNYLFAKKGTTLTRDQVRDRDRILVEQVTAYIRDHYAEQLEVDELFKPFYLHPNYCRNIFKKVAGKPVRTYLLEIRLTAARSRILDTDETLEEIAEKTGFNDYFYFLRAFKKYHGITPGSLRKKSAY